MDLIESTKESLTINREAPINRISQLNDLNMAENGNRVDAVYVRNLRKSYDNGTPIVSNFCMSVQQGTVYSLLGASGCGKTTVLSCIVGLKEWDAGEVLVFGKVPGSKGCEIPGRALGYMPQEIALYNHLAIREVITLYSRLHNMQTEKLKDMWMFLNKLLQLPAETKLVKNLSGGQRRRVSLALALLHSPKLLILDEPTVGLDPLLRSKIWDYLYKITSTTGTTIIITTHYIEEARHSNKIGVMRGGRLLVEDTPKNLLEQYKSDLLEDVVTLLCRKDEQAVKNGVPQPQFLVKRKHRAPDPNINDDADECTLVAYESVDAPKNYNFRVHHSLTEQESCATYSKSWLCRHAQRIYGLTTVMLLTFQRFPLFLLFILCMPTIQGTITLLTLGSKMKNMHFGIVNHESYNWIEDCNFDNLSVDACDMSTLLSCRYINELKKGDLMIMDAYSSEEEALSKVHQGEAWGYMIFSTNYSQSFIDRVGTRYFATNESIEGAQIHTRLDFSQFIAAAFMVRHIFMSYQNYFQQFAIACNFGSQEAMVPLVYRAPVYGNDIDDYTDFILPGIIICSLLLMVGSLAALFFIADYKQGTLSRARVAGLTTADLMISHLITQTIIALGQIIIWSFVLYVIFRATVLGPFWLYFIFCVLVGLCGTGLGLLIGTVCRDEVSALVIGIFLIPIFLLFGGVVFPTEAMSHFWQSFGRFVPTNLSTDALRSVITRGVSWNHPLVWPGILAILGWTIVFITLAVISYRKLCK